MNEEKKETCYFCGVEYVETWPLEHLACTACPECCSSTTEELAKKYPEKVEAIAHG
jgi:hypothetical protein